MAQPITDNDTRFSDGEGETLDVEKEKFPSNSLPVVSTSANCVVSTAAKTTTTAIPPTVTTSVFTSSAPPTFHQNVPQMMNLNPQYLQMLATLAQQNLHIRPGTIPPGFLPPPPHSIPPLASNQRVPGVSVSAAIPPAQVTTVQAVQQTPTMTSAPVPPVATKSALPTLASLAQAQQVIAGAADLSQNAGDGNFHRRHKGIYFIPFSRKLLFLFEFFLNNIILLLFSFFLIHFISVFVLVILIFPSF